jgi:hypothetical protein
MSDALIVSIVGAGVGVVGMVITFIKLYFKKRGINKSRVDYKILKYHDIFDKIDNWINSRIPNTCFGDKGRSLVIADSLKIKLHTFKENLNLFVRNKNNFKCTAEEFHIMCTSLIFNSLSQSESIETSEGIPDIYITKFRLWNHKTVLFTKNCVDNICRSKYYSSNSEKMYAIMNMFTASIESTINDAERTLRFLNGELSGIIYKGLEIDAEKYDNNKISFVELFRYTKDGIITSMSHEGEDKLGYSQIDIIGSNIFKYINVSSMEDINLMHSSIKNKNSDENNINTVKITVINSDNDNIELNIKLDVENDTIIMKMIQ